MNYYDCLYTEDDSESDISLTDDPESDTSLTDSLEENSCTDISSTDDSDSESSSDQPFFDVWDIYERGEIEEKEDRLFEKAFKKRKKPSFRVFERYKNVQKFIHKDETFIVGKCSTVFDAIIKYDSWWSAKYLVEKRGLDPIQFTCAKKNVMNYAISRIKGNPDKYNGKDHRLLLESGISVNRIGSKFQYPIYITNFFGIDEINTLLQHNIPFIAKHKGLSAYAHKCINTNDTEVIKTLYNVENFERPYRDSRSDLVHDEKYGMISVLDAKIKCIIETNTIHKKYGSDDESIIEETAEIKISFLKWENPKPLTFYLAIKLYHMFKTAHVFQQLVKLLGDSHYLEDLLKQSRKFVENDELSEKYDSILEELRT